MSLNCRFLTSLAIATMLLSTAAARAQTAPSSQPGETPLDALIAYNKAMYAGDDKAMLSRQNATTDDEKKIARASAQSDAQVANLVKAAIAKFGKDAETKVSKAIGDTRAEDIKDTRIDGDHAELLDADGKTRVDLVLVDGKWKIKLPGSEEGGSPRETIDAILKVGNTSKVLVQDIEAGKFKTLEELIKAIEEAVGD